VGVLDWLGAKLGTQELRADSEQYAAWLADCADMSERRDDYKLSRDYKRGEQRVQLIEREREFLEASGYPFCENFCETIVETLVNRLRVRGFGSDNVELRDFAGRFWRQNRLDAGQKQVHDDAVTLGDGFVIVEPGEGGLPSAHRNNPDNVKVVYDAGEPLYAVKVWHTRRFDPINNPSGREIRRMNVYWPDEVEKFFSVAEDADWVPFVEPGEKRWWTLDGMESGEPIGIPVVHFAHKPCPHYGVSKLRSVIPQQDALNKSIIDFFWVMDAQGWPQQYAIGIGDESQIKRHPGSLWTIEVPEATFGQFDAADPTKSIQAIESQIKRMASRSQTPLHLMLAGGNLPSGETLKTSESGLAQCGHDFQVFNGNKWEDVVMLAARIERAFGDTDPEVEDVTLDCHWDRAESRSEIDEANTAVLYQSLGVSSESILEYLGFDPEVERERRERNGDAADVLLQRAEQMVAPTRSEELGGGEQPAQNPANRRVRQQT
jgi:hypothetical protein